MVCVSSEPCRPGAAGQGKTDAASGQTKSNTDAQIRYPKGLSGRGEPPHLGSRPARQRWVFAIESKEGDDWRADMGKAIGCPGR